MFPTFAEEFAELLNKTGSEAQALEWLWDHVQNYDTFTKDDFEACMKEYADKWRDIGANG